MKLRSLTVRDPEYAVHNAAHQIPLVAASSFTFETIQEGMEIFGGDKPGHIYGRFGNPTIDAAAGKIAALEAHGTEAEGKARGLFCSSGMAAIATSLLALCNKGHIILTHADLYGGTSNLIDQLGRHGIRRETVDLRDSEMLEDKLGENPDICVIYVETPSNPILRCLDLEYLADLAHHYGAKLIVDNTFCTPIVQQPLAFGADIVVHSTTKYLNGHGTGIGGAIVCRDPEIFTECIVPTYRLFGGNGNPWDAWLVLNGLKTLHLRMREHSANAGKVARYLARHPRVGTVHYPGLDAHPDCECVTKQMKLHGGILSFDLKGGTEAAHRFMNDLEFITLTPTLGDVDSLVLHPATMSHRGVDPEVRQQLGITDGLVRLSVGIEDVDDILMDLDRALG